LIRNISDTARWVAMYRAYESQRPDALFHDPWAEKLAGERGREIVASMPDGKRWGWPMVTRTAVMDEIILREVRDGVDTVINLAAGLDMRAFRLEVPSALRWVEVDLEPILEEKAAMIAGETPRCALTRIAADLADPAQRADALQRAAAGAKRALVVTEGLLIYLGADDVAALAKDLAAQPAIRSWLSDLASPQLLQWMAPRWGKVVAEGGAPFRFGPAEGTDFFKPFGWHEREFRGSMEEARRLGREMPMAWFYRLMGTFASAEQKRVWQRFSGFMVLDRE
jgi:methyltransferase (TIGR00027 family)